MVSINPNKVRDIINLPEIREIMNNDPFILQNFRKFIS